MLLMTDVFSDVFCIKLKSKHGKAWKHDIFCWSSKRNIQRFIQKTRAQTLLTIVSNSTKLIHQRLEKLEADITDINEKLKENVKDIDELKQSLQMYEDTNDKKLVEIDNSIKQQKIEHIAQVKDIQQVHNELKEKLRTLEDRSRRDNFRIDGIPEYEEESWDDTEELLKDALHEKLGVNKIYTAWKVSKYGVISGLYFPAFGLRISPYSVRMRENTNQK